MIASVDPRTGEVVAEVAEETTTAELDRICAEATEAVDVLDAIGRRGRAAMLGAMADALEARRDAIVALADRETGLGPARLGGELTRTCFQLRFFAEVIADGAYLEVVIDHAGDSPMGPRPDLRRMLGPLGVVGVFGASNFPLAFSVPGGDTASALAAGCPVVVKAHDAHPATSRLAADALAEGAHAAGVEAACVSLVFGQRAGVELVTHPLVQAIGFTGSLRGGRYLHDLAKSRPSPIPFYGELGALNAVVVCPEAARVRPGEIAAGLVGSFNLGVGQFCTKPGLVLLPDGEGGDAVAAELAGAVPALGSGVMLSESIAAAYSNGAAALRSAPGVRVLAEGAPSQGAGWWGRPLVLEADAGSLEGALLEECFGPVVVVLRYRDGDQAAALLDRLSPALTGTIHGEDADEDFCRPLLAHLRSRVGRLVWNGFPTGVAVSWAMHHGGPYPATTDPLHTSVGAAAIRRFLKPVVYQNLPEALLPPELRDEPPEPLLRRVDGRLELGGTSPR